MNSAGLGAGGGATVPVGAGAATGAGHGGLAITGALAEFASLLRRVGIRVGTGEILDAMAALGP